MTLHPEQFHIFVWDKSVQRLSCARIGLSSRLPRPKISYLRVLLCWYSPAQWRILYSPKRSRCTRPQLIEFFRILIETPEDQKMKQMIAVASCALLTLGATQARADFKYSDTSKITGGSLRGMMKAVGVFSKQASQAMKPVTTTRYIKGDRLREDDSDGKIQIIDLAGRRIIQIDPQKHTYTEITFDEMAAALKKMQDQMQQEMDKQSKDKQAKPQDVNASMNAKINVTPGTASRQIQGLNANELKVQIDMEFQAQPQDNGQNSGQPSGPVSGTISTSVDSLGRPRSAGL